MFLCRYNKLFGNPNKGIHKYRILNIAIVDLVMTIILSYVISKIINRSFMIILLFMFILSVFVHYIFCVNTSVMKLLFSMI
jgi:hypothetical protein